MDSGGFRPRVTLAHSMKLSAGRSKFRHELGPTRMLPAPGHSIQISHSQPRYSFLGPRGYKKRCIYSLWSHKPQIFSSSYQVRRKYQ